MKGAKRKKEMSNYMSLLSSVQERGERKMDCGKEQELSAKTGQTTGTSSSNGALGSERKADGQTFFRHTRMLRLSDS